MGRICGEVREISDIKAPLFLHGGDGGVVGGVLVKFPHLEKNYQFNEGPKI